MLIWCSFTWSIYVIWLKDFSNDAHKSGPVIQMCDAPDLSHSPALCVSYQSHHPRELLKESEDFQCVSVGWRVNFLLSNDSSTMI